MSNLAKDNVVFCYKGETLSLSITIELDEYLEVSNTLPDLYPVIAKANNHDLYSYEFEMMQAQTIVFSEAPGMVADFITDGLLDMDAFVQAWKNLQCLDTLGEIANDLLSIIYYLLFINDLDENPELKQALLETYKLGQSTCVTEQPAADPLLGF